MIRWLLDNPWALVALLLVLVLFGGAYQAAKHIDEPPLERPRWVQRLDQLNAWCDRTADSRWWSWYFGLLTFPPALVALHALVRRQFAGAVVWAAFAGWAFHHWRQWAAARPKDRQRDVPPT
jgi:hypothetical protein